MVPPVQCEAEPVELSGGERHAGQTLVTPRGRGGQEAPGEEKGSLGSAAVIVQDP